MPPKELLSSTETPSFEGSFTTRFVSCAFRAVTIAILSIFLYEDHLFAAFV